ncbi:GNAT family N-acetyltransferase [Pantoea sp. FN0302]|uniref:GNAT family N-acetyltransferase n=1 Tax=Pantoea sp. FN0302 TaxID=3418558 RepID=UPI003CE8D86D
MEIYLRPMLATDAADYAAAINESLSSLKPWMSWAHENYQPDEAIEWFRLIDRQREQGEANEMGIFAVSDHRFLGAAGIRYGQTPGEHCAIGYWVRQKEQRKGIARQAVMQLAREGFRRPEINVIEILAAEANAPSRAVAISCGAQLIALRYGLIVLDSGPVTAAIYHLQREDFITGHPAVTL